MHWHHAVGREQCAHWSNQEWRQAFVVSDLFRPGQISLAHWETDRTVLGGVVPLGEACRLPAPPELRAGSFMERRELGVINIGQAGTVAFDRRTCPLGPLDGLYLGRGTRDITFASVDPAQPAQFYLLSYPAHANHPAQLLRHQEAERTELGTPERANCRTLHKYIHPGGIASCQLVMGLTMLKRGSLWNTLPPHTHLRRSEVYLYFDLPAAEVVFHLAGSPEATRSLVLRDRQAVLSPPWSVHCGVGTFNYMFIWGMGGENQEFADMDPAPLAHLG
jgi:4-deoxy-L-threo-5-hexosulose-uronate ketol-isomerase